MITDKPTDSPDLRAALEELIAVADAAADCYYGGPEHGCDHRPAVREAAAKARAALAAEPSDPEGGDPERPTKRGPCVHGNPCRESQCVEYGRWAVPSSEAGREGLLERLAAIEHDQWVEWSRTVAEGGLTPERLARWEGYWRPYAELDEATKEHDRKWARLVLAALAIPPSEPTSGSVGAPALDLADDEDRCHCGFWNGMTHPVECPTCGTKACQCWCHERRSFIEPGFGEGGRP